MNGGPETTSRLQIASLISGLGALILGVGLGVWGARFLSDIWWPFVFAGVLLHGWGMLDSHRLKSREQVTRPCTGSAGYSSRRLRSMSSPALSIPRDVRGPAGMGGTPDSDRCGASKEDGKTSWNRPFSWVK